LESFDDFRLRPSTILSSKAKQEGVVQNTVE
ncbi:hypothetical protein CCACVL1_28354, partial [Corchorus capsularis]